MCTISFILALPVVVYCVYLIGAGSNEGNNSIRRVIIDVDAGPDDAWALYHLMSSPNVKIEAISCVKGNANVTMVGRNVMRILAAMGKENEVPVFLGSNERLITPEPTVNPDDMYFGVDGFSDVDYSHLPPPNMALLKTGAVHEIARLILKYPSEISFISLGPLTNLALALKAYPETRQLIKEVLIMGGNRHGVGNTESAAEFNFYHDPEGANIVLNNYPGPITILPWETANRENLVMNQTWRFGTIASVPPNPVLEILNPAERKALEAGANWLPCDLLVAMAFTHPELVTERQQYPGSVELAGLLTRGQLVLNHRSEGTGHITIVDNMDHFAVQRLIMGLAAG
ncbi:pyrimidine-specific ribonucleoside hydrolase RihA [Culex quinquefasciatus]|uniref:pyrimidine-specific ribonucleoside hydrolase RihA n=1 Tax=Culex quinquefasciatus TaxID=7176 RepID=UPI0018E2B67E|nr:pyrimidine-specific ribonucleoside hydrolase RihA [Culex quinquefasciatus]